MGSGPPQMTTEGAVLSQQRHLLQRLLIIFPMNRRGEQQGSARERAMARSLKLQVDQAMASQGPCRARLLNGQAQTWSAEGPGPVWSEEVLGAGRASGKGLFSSAQGLGDRSQVGKARTWFLPEGSVCLSLEAGVEWLAKLLLLALMVLSGHCGGQISVFQWRRAT